jgi:hypothetical protein
MHVRIEAVKDERCESIRANLPACPQPSGASVVTERFWSNSAKYPNLVVANQKKARGSILWTMKVNS